MKKIKIALIFGGNSVEHEISLLSAKNIIEAINYTKYETILIGIHKNGEWYEYDTLADCLIEENSQLKLNTMAGRIIFNPQVSSNYNKLFYQTIFSRKDIDVAFPILHGTNGEDGAIQGLLTLLNIPFIGCGILSSAINMNKDIMKRLLRDANIPIANFITVDYREIKEINFQKITDVLGVPLFIKPVSLGSSIGVFKIQNRKEFLENVKISFQFDSKIIIEECIKGREIECSVLGNNNNPIVSLPAEVILNKDFYSYKLKYLDTKTVSFDVPAKLTKEQIDQIQSLAKKVYTALYCEGMARIDFFLKEDGSLIINEVNTIPGFTKISMYPKMWIASGVSCGELIDRLVLLAIERHKKEGLLTRSASSFQPI